MSIVCQVFGDDCKSDFDMYGGVVLMALIVMYTFKVLGSICDGHLTTVVQTIVDKLGIPADVAGATFMAMASSAPEVFLTLISTFLMPSSAGVSCIAGSALFNLLIIVGVLPLVSSTGPLKINWFCTYRDCIYYGLSIIELSIFCLDGKITWWESLILVLTYLTYVIFFAFFNASWMEYYGLDLENDIQGSREYNGQVVRYPQLCRMLSKEKLSEKELQGRWADLKQVDWMSEVDLDTFFKARMLKYFESDDSVDTPTTSTTEPDPEVIGLHSVVLPIDMGSEKKIVYDMTPEKKIAFKLDDKVVDQDDSDAPQRMETKGKISDLQIKVNDLNTRIQKYQRSHAFAAVAMQTLEKRRSAYEQSLKVLKDEIDSTESEEEKGFFTRNDPGLILINKTIPPYNYTAICFVVVLLWVAFGTFMMSDSASRFGCTTSIPPFMMGLVFLAGGTSVPDLVASIAVAREGFADMAAANAIGGNTFKNFIGLGVPWLASALYQGPTEVPAGEFIEVCALMAITLVFYVACVRINGWVLNRMIGTWMMIVYSLSILYCVIRHYTYYAHQATE